MVDVYLFYIKTALRKCVLRACARIRGAGRSAEARPPCTVLLATKRDAVTREFQLRIRRRNIFRPLHTVSAAEILYTVFSRWTPCTSKLSGKV